MRSEVLPPSLVVPQPATVSKRPGVSRASWLAVAGLIGLMPVTARLSLRTAASYALLLLGLYLGWIFAVVAERIWPWFWLSTVRPTAKFTPRAFTSTMQWAAVNTLSG